MKTRDIVKLAPTLSVEERYKIIIPDCFRMLAGKETVLSESEIKAITYFEKRAIWEEYALRIGMFKWARILWMRDIQKEKFCVCTAILLLNDALWHVIRDVGDSAQPEALAKELASLRHYVSVLQGKLADFYAYRDAEPRLREELYGVPIFDEEAEATIHGFYQFAHDMVERHNGTVRELGANKELKRYFKFIAENRDCYLVKEPKPEEATVVKLVDEVRSYAQADVDARLGK